MVCSLHTLHTAAKQAGQGHVRLVHLAHQHHPQQAAHKLSSDGGIIGRSQYRCECPCVDLKSPRNPREGRDSLVVVVEMPPMGEIPVGGAEDRNTLHSTGLPA